MTEQELPPSSFGQVQQQSKITPTLFLKKLLDSQTHLRRENFSLAHLGSSVLSLKLALDKAEMWGAIGLWLPKHRSEVTGGWQRSRSRTDPSVANSGAWPPTLHLAAPKSRGASEDSLPPLTTLHVFTMTMRSRAIKLQSSGRGLKRTNYTTRSEQARERWFLAVSLELKSYSLENKNNSRKLKDQKK